MKKFFVLATLCMAAAVSRAAGISWLRSYSQAMAQAKQQHKMVMIDFYTGWCHWCKVLDKQTYPDPSVVHASSQFVSLKLDAEKEGLPQARKFGVSSYPTILFISPEERVLNRVEGFRQPPVFLNDIRKAQQVIQQSSTLSRRVQLNPKDPEARAQYAAFLAASSDLLGAEGQLAIAKQLVHQRPNEANAFAAIVIGDAYAHVGNMPRALVFFTQGANLTNVSRAKAHALVGMGAALMDTRQPKKAKQVLLQIFKLPDVTNQDRSLAQDMLQKAG